MSFTEIFIKLPVKILNGMEQIITGKDDDECEQFDDYIFINPFEIESYSATIPTNLEFAKGNQICTVIRTRSGDERLIFMKLIDFEKLLNGYV